MAIFSRGMSPRQIAQVRSPASPPEEWQDLQGEGGALMALTVGSSSSSSDSELSAAACLDESWCCRKMCELFA